MCRDVSFAVGLALAAALPGCSSGPPLEGVVTLDGKPLAFANVMLVPDGEPDTRPVASGNTDREGKFQLQRIGGDGAAIPPGTYKVIVTAADPAIKISSRYSDPAKTPLSAKIPPEGPFAFSVEK